MLKKTFLIATAAWSLWLACGAGLELGFNEPASDDVMLVVGRVLLETGTTLTAGLFDGEINVAIVGQTQQGKTVGFWTKTDPDGYYAFSGVPKGQYMLKTIKAMVRDVGVVTITSRLTGGNYFYYLSKDEFVPLSGDYFPYEAAGRIVDLRHFIVRLEDPALVKLPVQSDFYPRLSGYKTVTGQILNAPPVPQYYIDKYPDSAWKTELTKTLLK